MLGVFLIVLPFTKAYSQGLPEYCPSGFICQFIYVPASFNILNSSLGQAQETETRLVVRNTDISRSIFLAGVYLLGPNEELIKSYITERVEVTYLSSSVSFLTPNSDSGIAKYSDDDGRPFFIVDVHIPDTDPPVTPPIFETERSILNFNRARS